MLQLINYSEKAVALVGDTREIKDELKALGGRFNAKLSCGAGWRCPTRHEWLDIYDMRFNGLDEFRKRLGMKPLDGWYWSCEEDADPQYSAQNAWLLYTYGLVLNLSKRSRFRVCAVSAF